LSFWVILVPGKANRGMVESARHFAGVEVVVSRNFTCFFLNFLGEFQIIRNESEGEAKVGQL